MIQEEKDTIYKILEETGYKIFGDDAFYKKIGFALNFVQINDIDIELTFVILGANNQTLIWNKLTLDVFDDIELGLLRFEARLSKHSELRTDFEEYKKWIESFNFNLFVL